MFICSWNTQNNIKLYDIQFNELLPCKVVRTQFSQRLTTTLLQVEAAVWSWTHNDDSILLFNTGGRKPLKSKGKTDSWMDYTIVPLTNWARMCNTISYIYKIWGINIASYIPAFKNSS